MIIRILKDTCTICGESPSTKEGEYKIKARHPIANIEFDKKGNRYIVFQLDDPPESTKIYLQGIKKKEIKPTR